MKLSARSRYGVRMMLNLALHYNMGAVRMSEVAKDEGISEKYLSQLVLPLKSRGLLISTRGTGGGHALAKHPSEITLKVIVETLEGDLQLVDCKKSQDGICKRVPTCVVLDVWKTLSNQLSDGLSKVSLQDLVERQQLRSASPGSNMYQI